jgi:hypothetical protein
MHKYLDLPTECIEAYITITERMNPRTAHIHRLRLKNFDTFSQLEYRCNTDNLLNLIKTGNLDPYQILNKYALCHKYCNSYFLERLALILQNLGIIRTQENHKLPMHWYKMQSNVILT